MDYYAPVSKEIGGHKMRKVSAVLFTALAAVSLSVPAHSSVVYDNGAPLGTNGLEATLYVEADDFTLASSTNLATAGIYFGTPAGLGSWDGNVFWNIFADAGGAPGASVASGGGLVAGGATTTAFTCPQCANNPEVYLVEFGLNNFAAAGGTTYWLGIHLSSDFSASDGVYWMNAASNGTNPALSSVGGTFNNWTDFEVGQTAFYLTDAAEGAVPEPSTWAMMLLGFGATGFALRRSRKPEAKAALA